MFTDRTGVCSLNLGNFGNNPFAVYSNAACFESCYLPTTKDMNCVNTFSTSNQNCQYSKTCGNEGECYLGNCWSTTKPSNPNAFQSNNPQIIKELPWNDAYTHAKANGYESEFNEFAKQFAFGDIMYIIESQGKMHLACPLNIFEYQNKAQAVACLKTVWQCERFRDFAAQNNPEAEFLYNVCKRYESYFLFDVVTPQGRLIPAMAVINEESLPVIKAALKKCSVQVSNVDSFIPFDSLALQ